MFPVANEKSPSAAIWLSRCCEQSDGIACATLYLQGSGTPAARWPDPDDDANDNADIAMAALAARRVTTRPRPKTQDGESPEGQLVAIPIEIGKRNLAVAVVTSPNSDFAGRESGAEFQSNGKWLPILLSNSDSKGSGKHALLTKLVTTLLEPEEASAAYLALASELATALACDRVSVGLLSGEQVRLEAVSHSARFDPRTRLGRAIASAMEESIDAECAVRWPGEAEKAPCRAHASLCQSHEMGCAFSVPLTSHGVPVGAICAEYRDRHPAGPVIAARMEQLATLLGPLIALRRDQALPVTQRIARALQQSYETWTSEQRRNHHVLACAFLLVFALLAVLPGTHRISAPAQLEGLIQRAIVAPVDGYVAESRARAGDTIKRGTVLGAIDDTELLLEQQKWTARTAQLNKEYRGALAARDRSETNILRARLAQASVESELVNQQLERTRLVAPFDGVVAEGDLSRSLGSPVERGDVLFQIAPLDQYRIVLEVHETEIDEIKVEQTGWLKLTAQPGDDLAMSVDRVVPIAVADDGRNFFRVEAKLKHPEKSLRPGMEGVGKIEVGSRSLLWIYTHSFFDWLRLRVWAWLP